MLVEKQKGITLVALIITVIVLLILATVSIQVLTGDNGLITKTETAVQSNKDSQEEEKVKLAVSAAQLAGNGTIKTENLNNELRSNFDDNNISVEEKSEGWLFKRNREYKIYKDGKIECGDFILLPKEYQQVEYIESTGTQYIDTGIKPSLYTDIKLKCYVPFNSTNTKSIYWTRRDVSNMRYTTFGLILNSKSNIRAYRLSQGDSSISTNLSNTLSNEIIYETKGDSYTINGNTYTFSSPEINSLDYSIYLFGLNENGSNYTFTAEGGIKLYYFKIYENNGLVRDFIPCYRKLDNKPGLYDTVEGKFYTNQGSEEFYLPPEKNYYQRNINK